MDKRKNLFNLRLFLGVYAYCLPLTFFQEGVLRPLQAIPTFSRFLEVVSEAFTQYLDAGLFSGIFFMALGAAISLYLVSLLVSWVIYAGLERFRKDQAKYSKERIKIVVTVILLALVTAGMIRGELYRMSIGA